MTIEVVDLFCGAGGFSTGAAAAGATVVLAVEADARIAEVYRANFPDHPLRVHTLESADVPTLAAELAPRASRLHMHGSPPCQKLSQANKRQGDAHEGLRLVELYLDLVERVRPRTWSMEQVHHPELLRYLTARGIAHAVVDASDHGVPQRRRRVVAGAPEVIAALGADATVPVLPRDVLTDLKPPERYALMSSQDNQPVRERVGKVTRTVGCRPMRAGEGARPLDHPAHTVVCRPGKIYDTVTGEVARRLTPRECALLQGFPPEFQLDTRSDARSYRVVGNAVPPPLARAIVRAARASSARLA